MSNGTRTFGMSAFNMESFDLGSSKAEQAKQTEQSEKDSTSSWLPDCEITFNPSDKKSVNMLLSKYGPEGLHEIAATLNNAANEDIDFGRQE